MRLAISARLQLAILGVAALAVALVAGASRWNLERAFLGYLDQLAVQQFELVLPRLEQAYAAHGDWRFLLDERRLWFKVLRGDTGPDDDTRRSFDTALDATGGLSRLGLLDAGEAWVVGHRGLQPPLKRAPVVVRGQTVGWLVLAPFNGVADEGSRRFMQAQWNTTAVAALLAVCLAAATGWWLTRQLLAPVRAVAQAARRLSAGRYGVRLDVRSDDGLGRLAQDFNTLAATLQRNESLRREFFADISHDLRTPLAVLTGELDALEDGVRPLNLAAVRSLQAEARCLQELVERLHELALSDAGSLAYRMDDVDLAGLVARAVDAHRGALEEKGLGVSVTLPRETATVRGDAPRLHQLLSNLLHNSGRYTDAPGHVRVELRCDARRCSVEVEDSAPGVPAEHFDRLFERFFRVDGSRNRATAGAGLGLAIARNIAQAHGASVGARPSALGGLSIRIDFPRAAAP